MTSLIKLRESDYSIVLEKEYGHVALAGATVRPNYVYASSSSLLLLLYTDFSPAWSVDTDRDFVVLKLSLDGSSVVSAFGFGSNTGTGERSHGVEYIETEGAAVLTFYAHNVQCMYLSKVTMSTSALEWSKKLCIGSITLDS